MRVNFNAHLAPYLPGCHDRWWAAIWPDGRLGPFSRVVYVTYFENCFAAFLIGISVEFEISQLLGKTRRLHAATLDRVQLFVHGDVRDVNIMVRKDGKLEFMLVDFDWSGIIGEARYPININKVDLWRPEDVSDGQLIKSDHDILMLDHIFRWCATFYFIDNVMMHPLGFFSACCWHYIRRNTLGWFLDFPSGDEAMLCQWRMLLVLVVFDDSQFTRFGISVLTIILLAYVVSRLLAYINSAECRVSGCWTLNL